MSQAEAQRPTVRYVAPPTVARFMDSNAFVRAIVGPVGSGKSSGSIMEILRRAMEQAPSPQDGVRRYRQAVIRNTYRELQDTTRKTFEQWMPEGIGRWSESDFTFEINRKLKDGTRLEAEVLFRALDKPADVKKLLSLELTGAYINEAREVPQEIFNGVQMRVGRYPSKVQGGPSWYGVWADTNPWSVGSWGHTLFSVTKPPEHELFEQPDALGPLAENLENLPGPYYTRMCAGKDEEWINEYVRAQYPKADKGSVFGKWITKLIERGGFELFEHPLDGVFVTFDLGVSDSTAIFFWRMGRRGVPDIIDWYEASGEGAEHYFEVIRQRGYAIRKVWLPHDARARTFQTGTSTLELFVKEFGLERVAITPELDVADGIGAARWMLEQPMRIHPRCAGALTRLRAYRYKWDDNNKVYSKEPLHDWTSHTADAFRYVACALKSGGFIAAAEEEKKEQAKVRAALPPGRISIGELVDNLEDLDS